MIFIGSRYIECCLVQCRKSGEFYIASERGEHVFKIDAKHVIRFECCDVNARWKEDPLGIVLSRKRYLKTASKFYYWDFKQCQTCQILFDAKFTDSNYHCRTS